MSQPMKPLMDDPNADIYISRELERARIPAVKAGYPNGVGVIIPYTLIGLLPGPLTFERDVSHYRVRGPVPIDVAEELYADPVGKSDIRVAGDPSCSDPSNWTHWLVPESSERLRAVSGQELKDYMSAYVAWPIPEGWYAVPPDKIEAVEAQQYVIEYEIHSEIGLRVFVDILRAHNLVAESSPDESVAA